MQAVLLDADTLGPEINWSPIKELVPLVAYSRTEDSEVTERVHGNQIVLTNKVHLTREHFKRNPEIRFIGVLATGVNNIDLTAARDAGIKVCHVRNYCNQSVAEYVIMMILNLNFQLMDCLDQVWAGRWEKSPHFTHFHRPFRELKGQHLLLVGSGSLGTAVGEMAKNFGMKVTYCARPGEHSTPGRPSLSQALPEADVVSLHCPLTDVTKGLIDDEALGLMKPTAILINCARGGIVQEEALLAAVKSGRIRGAAIDVLNQEPPQKGSLLLEERNPRLLVTPHVAWASIEARQRLIDIMGENIGYFLSGRIQNEVAVHG